MSTAETNILSGDTPLRKVYIETFGCQMNDNDSLRMFSILKRAGFEKTPFTENADLILLNTCSIREKAEHKVYSTVGKFRKQKESNPSLIIGITGCVAQQEGEKLLKRIPYLDLVLGTQNIHTIGEIVLKILNDKNERLTSIDTYKNIQDGEFEAVIAEEGAIRADVSIMRGCDHFCTFCVVPFVRGREVSRPHKGIISDIEELVSKGVKEVNLLGQNVNSYGKKTNEISFADLLRKVCRVDGLERVRYITSHPADFDDELIEMFGEEEKLCRNLHLPIQSGSQKILDIMRRGHTVEDYLSKVEKLRSLYPDFSLSTDMIVGFPGESDEDFEMTMDVVKQVKYDTMFSFKYSPRPNTKAIEFDGQVPLGLQNERLAKLQELQKEISKERSARLIGKTLNVLVEGISKNNKDELMGRTSCNRVVNFDMAVNCSPGTIVGLKISDAFTNSLRAF